ncbi:MAG: hypothetical protein PHO60_00125 [Methanothrix sp.]|nr:hypothetical protein [Methanothrix sp.]MDD5768316.1 hypothetical protein [Methanothrix sp.]
MRSLEGIDRRLKNMRAILALLAAVAVIGSAAAWDISEELQYTYTKSGYEQAGYGILDQVVGTTSGAYAKEPNVNFGDGWEADAWLQIDNTLLTATIDRTNTNPDYNCNDNDFYVQLTQGGSATLSTSAKNTETTDPEISGEATAYQNLWVGGEFSKADASFDSRAIVGFSDIKDADYTGPTEPNNFVATDVVSATASIDSQTYGAGYFNDANMGVQVDADIQQNYVGSGWADPTYSGGITMWANFDGACDPNCANPIITTVSGSAFTALFPADTDDLNADNIGDTAYWGENFKTNPQVTSSYGGTFNDKWADVFA